MRWAGHVARMGEERGVYRVLVRKPEGKRPLGRPRYRWVDTIKMDLQELGCRYMDWIGLAQDRDRWWTLVIAVMKLRVPWNAGNFLTSCKPVSFSRRTLHHGVSNLDCLTLKMKALQVFRNVGNCSPDDTAWYLEDLNFHHCPVIISSVSWYDVAHLGI